MSGELLTQVLTRLTDVLADEFCKQISLVQTFTSTEAVTVGALHFWKYSCVRKIARWSNTLPLAKFVSHFHIRISFDSAIRVIYLFIFCILLVFIDLSYLQELLQTKRLYTTSYIGVIVIYKKWIIKKQ